MALDYMCTEHQWAHVAVSLLIQYNQRARAELFAQLSLHLITCIVCVFGPAYVTGSCFSFACLKKTSATVLFLCVYYTSHLTDFLWERERERESKKDKIKTTNKQNKHRQQCQWSSCLAPSIPFVLQQTVCRTQDEHVVSVAMCFEKP